MVAVNYRGSNGRGSAFQKAIFADWGGKEVVDLLGAMDHVQKIGLADPDRLGIGGWSYGGILTDYTIATDGRFKAATSGAGSALQLSMYGVDQYITQYEQEIGPPWKSPDLWMKISYPFFHADRIKTPTLFLVGEKDFNVPTSGSEQMYQALKSLGVDTQLVIYPGQFHGITTPTYKIDRLQRYLDWYGKYLKPGKTTTTTAGGAEMTRREFFKRTATDAAIAGFLAAAGGALLEASPLRLADRQPDLSPPADDQRRRLRRAAEDAEGRSASSASSCARRSATRSSPRSPTRSW